MQWPYHLVDLSSSQKHERRVLLNRYGVYAQLSPLVPILVYRLYRLAVWVYLERRRAKAPYDAVPSSPRLKHAKLARSGALRRRWRSAVWWLDGEVREGWGERRLWVLGMIWALWMGVLCVRETGDDYMHITRRFGIVAAALFPFHYMLSMKSLFSPLSLIFSTSHEQLNAYHRLSGRIIYTLLLLHGSFYLNFFYQAGLIRAKLTSKVVWIGVIALLMMSILASTSLQNVRRWSYRVFFIIHLVVGVSILPLLFFHARPLRMYTIEALALFIFDIACRKLDTVPGFATITAVPNTKLVKLTIPIPSSKIQRFEKAPGQHVYLQIPQESVPRMSNRYLHELLYNPFTIASVNPADLTITLVLRTLDGPMTRALEALSHLSKASPPLHIEGPLGSSKYFPNLATEYDRILLVAGGVGATFILPIYRQLQEQMLEESRGSDRVKMIWSMRDGAEAAWALPLKPRAERSNYADSAHPEDATLPIDQDANISLFFTHSLHTPNDHGPSDGTIQLSPLPNGKSPDNDMNLKATGGNGRPNLRRIVEETFRGGKEEKVAILVCGPEGMARELREYVGRYVESGREVWFHDESFGW